MAAHDPSLPECKRLVRVANLIEENLKNNLDTETEKLCWFGDDDTVVRELEKHSTFG